MNTKTKILYDQYTEPNNDDTDSSLLVKHIIRKHLKYELQIIIVYKLEYKTLNETAKQLSVSRSYIFNKMKKIKKIINEEYDKHVANTTDNSLYY